MSQQVNVKRYATVEEAAKANDFYVVNTSDFGGTQPRGQLIFGIKTPDGEIVRVLIPPTWIPIDLTGYASPAILANASILREYLRKGAIVMIDKASYDNLVAHPKYAEAFAAASKKMGGFAAGVKQDFALAVGATSSTIVDGANTNSIQARESSITNAILAAQSDEEIIARFDEALPGLQVEDYRYLTTKAINGSLIQMVAIELETTLVSGQMGSITSIKQTEAYKHIQQSGKSSEPVIAF